MTSIWSLVLLGVLVCLGFIAWTFKARLPKTNVPTPLHHWFLGVLPTVLKNKDRVNEIFTETELKYGSFAFANPARSPAIFMGIDPRNVEYVLKTNFWNYEKPKDSKLLLQEFFGKGIFSADGEDWRIQRKTASHMFSLKELRDEMVYVFIKHAHTLIDKLAKLKPEETIDMQDMMFRYTLTSFAEVAFGYDIKGITTDQVPFAAAFDEVQLKCAMRARNPLWRVMRFLNLGEERKLAKSVKIINSFAYERIKDGRRKVAEMKEQGREAKLNEHMDLVMRFVLEAEKNGEQPTDEYLRDMVINFIIAGRDTTACLLSWTLYMLHAHPDQADRLYRENYEVLQECHGEPDYAAASKMDLCEAILNETLRLYPSVPNDMKCAVKDDVLPDGTIVPAGCRVLYSPWAHGRSAKLWVDPLTWNPDRWLGVDPPTQYAFPHFNAGPRLCLGKTLALLEAKIILSMLNNRFRFKLADGVNVKYQVNITLPMASPLKMHVLPR